MLSSKFLVVSFLYIFYAAGLATASPRNQPGGGNQFCQSVRTVTVTKTVVPGQTSPPANNGQPPAVTGPPGNVNLGNGSDKNTKTSSAVKNTQTPPIKNGDNNNPGNGNNNPKDDKTSTKNNNINTGVLNVKTTSTAAPPANTGTGNTGAGNPAAGLTLDPSVIQNVDGKGQAAGEADSLVSPNNFINFCVGKTLTNGKQVQTGSCNPTPMGNIPSVDKMPSAKFNFPRNFDTIGANTPFTISLKISNLVAGTFTNAANTYYAAPQQLVNGVIQGHSHVTVQKMTSLDSPEPLNPKIFDFFKGLNAAANNGILTADVTKGLPAGVYRIFSINSAGNHQEALGPVAQRGSFNDAIYITVAEGGQNTNTVSSSAVPPSTSPAVPSSKGNDGKNNTVKPSELPVSTKTGGKDNVVTSSEPPVPTKTGGKDNVVSSSEPPVPTSKGGKDGVATSSEPPVPTNNGGKDNVTASSKPPVSTNTGGGKDGKGGDVLSTPAALPKPTPPASGNGKPDTKNPAVSSPASPPGSTPTQGANDKGGKQYPRRMHRLSRST